MPATGPLAPYDGLLYLSFGGPERQEDVMPFLRNVTAGRGIPDERLEEVATHYRARGGKSPINDENRAVLARLHAELGARDIDVPVVWGNKFFDPYTLDALEQAREAGVRRLLTIVTSAFASYSGCRSYREDLAAAAAQLGSRDGQGGSCGEDDLRIDVLRPYGVLAAANATLRRLVLAGLAQLCAQADLSPGQVRVLFVTHSIPDAMNAASGPPDQPDTYERTHTQLCVSLAEAIQAETGVAVPWQLVYCSRSGPPTQPWLEPDINDAIADLATSGSQADGAQAVGGVLIVPIGFVSDHMEVVYDLDEEAMTTAREHGLAAVRVPTVRDDAQFVAGLVDELLERARAEREAPDTPGLRCPVGCCAGRGPAKPTVSDEA